MQDEIKKFQNKLQDMLLQKFVSIPIYKRNRGFGTSSSPLLGLYMERSKSIAPIHSYPLGILETFSY